MSLYYDILSCYCANPIFSIESQHPPARCADVSVENEHSDDSEFSDGLVHLSMNKLPSPDYFTCHMDNVGPLRTSSRCHSPLHMLATFSPAVKDACRNSILATCSAVHTLTKKA